MAKLKKKSKHVLWFFDFVYCQEICVIFAPTHSKFVQLAKKETGFDVEKADGISGEFHGLNTKKGGSLALVWSSDKDANLMHEMFHVCSWVLRNRGIYLTEESEESYAYYLTYLVRTAKEYIKGGE